MKLNQKGSTLVLVLIVILIFTVLGASVLANTVGESKRTAITENSMQARQLAESGITYFESAFKQFVNEKKNEDSDSINIFEFLDRYKDWNSINMKSDDHQLKIKVNAIRLEDENNLEVTSLAKVGDSQKELKAYYMLKYEFYEEDGPVFKIADFTADDTLAIDFAHHSVVGVNLYLLNLDLIKIKGNKNRYFRVPDDEVFGVKLLEHVLNFSIGDGNRFETVENNRIIATSQGSFLGLDFLGSRHSAIVQLNLIKFKEKKDTNVLIDGGFKAFELLGLRFDGFRNIDFLKFAVMGNAVIQQDRDGWGPAKDKADLRRFTFKEGLFVNKSLIIGGQRKNESFGVWEDYSKLMLRGDMVAMENLAIHNVDLKIGDSDTNETTLTPSERFTNIYVHGDAHIYDSCIHLKNNNYDFGIFVKGKLTFENNTLTNHEGCNTFPGIYYAENGIDVKTNNKEMIIDGALIGDVNVDYPEKLIIHQRTDILPKIKIKNIKLIPTGRLIK